MELIEFSEKTTSKLGLKGVQLFGFLCARGFRGFQKQLQIDVLRMIVSAVRLALMYHAATKCMNQKVYNDAGSLPPLPTDRLAHRMVRMESWAEVGDRVIALFGKELFDKKVSQHWPQGEQLLQGVRDTKHRLKFACISLGLGRSWTKWVCYELLQLPA